MGVGKEGERVGGWKGGRGEEVREVGGANRDAAKAEAAPESMEREEEELGRGTKRAASAAEGGTADQTGPATPSRTLRPSKLSAVEPQAGSEEMNRQ